MGAIQQAINQTIGTVSGAVALGQHMAKESADITAAKALTEKVNQEETIKLTEAIPSLNEEIAKGELEIKDSQAGIDKVSKGRTNGGQFRSKSDVAEDIRMRTLALKTLEGKQAARKMTLAGYQQRFAELRGGTK